MLKKVSNKCPFSEIDLNKSSFMTSPQWGAPFSPLGPNSLDFTLLLYSYRLYFIFSYRSFSTGTGVMVSPGKPMLMIDSTLRFAGMPRSSRTTCSEVFSVE